MRFYYRGAIGFGWKAATPDFFYGTQLTLTRYWMWQWQRDEIGNVYLTHVPGVLK